MKAFTQGTFEGVRKVLYLKLIKPISTTEDGVRQELIFNIIIVSVLGLICFLNISVIYADLADISKVGFKSGTFSLFIPLFLGLLVLSRIGKTRLASNVFIAIYMAATTYGVYSWGTEVPLALLSYALIIIITSILVSTRSAFLLTLVIIFTLTALGYLEANSVIKTDLSWRNNPPTFKDTLEDSFIYLAIIVVSWLSNKDLEKSLRRARASEKSLIEERNLLENKVEERTKDFKAIQQEKVAQLYKFVEFGRLSSGVFHDILNPLTTMSLTVEELHNSAKFKNPEYVLQLKNALNASKRIESFIAITRKQLDSEGVRELFIVENEIQEAADLLLHKFRTLGIKFTIDTCNQTKLHGNSVKFFQVVLNLLSNAIDSFSVENLNINKEIIVKVISNETTLELYITDNGSGIEQSIIQKIFEPFFTTKTKITGMGLGLSTTKEIVEKDFKGSIKVTSTLGLGSTFKVTVPI